MNFMLQWNKYRVRFRPYRQQIASCGRIIHPRLGPDTWLQETQFRNLTFTRQSGQDVHINYINVERPNLPCFGNYNLKKLPPQKKLVPLHQPLTSYDACPNPTTQPLIAMSPDTCFMSSPKPLQHRNDEIIHKPVQIKHGAGLLHQLAND